METSVLQSRLQGIILAITNLNRVHIESYMEDFIEDFTGNPGGIWVLTLTYLPKYTHYSIKYFAWETTEDGPIPGIQLFPDENIYLETDMKPF